MKRFLGIMVLGLLFGANAYANDPKIIFCKRITNDNKTYVYEKIIYPKSASLNKVSCGNESWNKNSIIISVEDYIYNVLVKHLDQDNLFGNSLGLKSLTEVLKLPSSDILHKLFSLFRTYKIYGLDESLIAKVASTEERFYVYKEALNKNGHKLNKTLLGKKMTGLTEIDKKIFEESEDLLSNNFIEQLKDLGDLYKSGALTKEEFTKLKEDILK
jgi:hypothetical protein